MSNPRGSRPRCLAQSEIVPYLLSRGLIGTKPIVDGVLSVVDASRRNRNFMVVCPGATSYLVKQGATPQGCATVAREAALYEFFSTLDPELELAEVLPRYHGYDAEERVLILELVPDARTIREHQLRIGRFPVGLARRVARALAGLHRLRDDTQRPPIGGFSREVPWVLSFHRSDVDTLRDISGAGYELLRATQRLPDFCDLLDEVDAGWRAGTLTHLDVRWDNWIAFAPAGAGSGWTGLKWIDWELAGDGDAGWDVGSVFADYLGWWLFTIPLTGEEESKCIPDGARYPLAKMQPALRSFWQRYAQSMKLEGADEAAELLRAVRYAAVRLLQAAYERMRFSSDLDPAAAYTVRLSWNMLRATVEACPHLLGIPVPEGALA